MAQKLWGILPNAEFPLARTLSICIRRTPGDAYAMHRRTHRAETCKFCRKAICQDVVVAHYATHTQISLMIRILLRMISVRVGRPVSAVSTPHLFDLRVT